MGKHSPPLWLSECSSKTWTRYLRTLKNTRQARIEDQRIQYMYRWTGDELPIFPPVSTNLDTRQPESQKREPNVQKAHPWLWLCCSVTQLCLTLFDPMDCTPGFPVLHYLLEFAQTHVHWVKDEVQPSHPLLSLSPPAFNLSQHQGLFLRVDSASGGQIIGISASASILPMNIQGWFPLGLTGLISLLSGLESGKGSSCKKTSCCFSPAHSLDPGSKLSFQRWKQELCAQVPWG